MSSRKPLAFLIDGYDGVEDCFGTTKPDAAQVAVASSARRQEVKELQEEIEDTVRRVSKAVDLLSKVQLAGYSLAHKPVYMGYMALHNQSTSLLWNACSPQFYRAPCRAFSSLLTLPRVP